MFWFDYNSIALLDWSVTKPPWLCRRGGIKATLAAAHEGRLQQTTTCAQRLVSWTNFVQPAFGPKSPLSKVIYSTILLPEWSSSLFWLFQHALVVAIRNLPLQSLVKRFVTQPIIRGCSTFQLHGSQSPPFKKGKLVQWKLWASRRNCDRTQVAQHVLQVVDSEPIFCLLLLPNR